MKTAGRGKRHVTRSRLLASALVFSFAFSVSVWASPWDRVPLTVGHRGTTVLEDENTLAAFQAAAEHGLSAFECDPRLTKDGVYVIMHDETVDRTTNGHGKVSEMTLSEIKKLRTAHGHQVPTLEEALLFAKERGMFVYLDIKEPPPDGGKLLVDIIRRTGMTENVIAGCWHKKTCRMIESLAPEISTCISWPWPALTLGQARRLGADAVGTLKGFASPWAIKAAHKKGLHMITMPINKPKKMEKFKTRGLDALQTDDPRLISEDAP